MNALDAGLTPSAGYGIVVGLGLGFAILMAGVTRIVSRYTAFDAVHNSEELSSASRSLKMGFITSGIVSAAVWASTLLQSAAVTFAFGIGGPWWYAMSGGSQIALFAQNAVMLKRNAPGAHTFCEFIGYRWGPWLHVPAIVIGIGTNIILTGQLITGSSSTLNALTGMNVIAACWLVPLGVVIYTVIGGLRATFLSDYLHTAVIFAALLAMAFSMYSSNEYLGSPSKVYDLLVQAAAVQPVSGNAEGSYLTMRSSNGVAFGALATIAGSCTVFLDQTYWQRAVASKASQGFEGYILGGLCFLAVPLGFATCAGLAVICLTIPPGAPFHPLTASESGLVAAAGINVLLGKSGALLLIIVLFLAVTSAASAELVAVSSILVYDVYKRYINPNPTDKQIMFWTHVSCIFYGIVMACIGIIFYEIGISLGWLFGFTATWASAAVVPVGMALRVRRANKWFCLAGIVLGMGAGFGVWCGIAKGYYGSVSVDNLGATYSELGGAGAAFVVSAIICFTGLLVAPQDYDFDLMRRRDAFQPKGVDAYGHQTTSSPAQAVLPEAQYDPNVADREEDDEKKVGAARAAVVDSTDAAEDIYVVNDVDDKVLKRKFVWSVWATIIAQVGLCFIIKTGFYVWIVFVFVTLWFATCVCIFLPLWESSKELWSIGKAALRDLGIGRK